VPRRLLAAARCLVVSWPALPLAPVTTIFLRDIVVLPDASADRWARSRRSGTDSVFQDECTPVSRSTVTAKGTGSRSPFGIHSAYSPLQTPPAIELADRGVGLFDLSRPGSPASCRKESGCLVHAH
jgi:hypothetical protein